MHFAPQAIPAVVLIRHRVFADERGQFMEHFRQDLFNQHCGVQTFVQHNQSQSKQGVLRGLHYQHHRPQGKLLRVSHGELFDVSVDLRQNSPTFGQWVGVYLNAKQPQSLWVPPGFAHGFYVLSQTAVCDYQCTDYYHPDDEYTLAWDDPSLQITWPLLAQHPPLLSSKDRQGLSLSQCPHFYF